MYKLQWAYVCNEDGTMIDVEDFEYHDTAFTYEDYDDAMHDRNMMMQQVKDKYIRVRTIE